MNDVRKKQIRDLCLCLGTVGLTYALLLLVFVLFTGINILKLVVFIFALSSLMFSLSLSPMVKVRLKQRIKNYF